MDADVIVVGAGLAGLAATAELARAGRRVLLLDQEPGSNLGGQAFWSFGGLFLVDSPEQRRMGIKDSRELAWQDWTGSAYFDRGVDDPAGEDYWAYRWAEAYVDFAAGEKRSWLHAMGVRWFPLVGWAERGGYLADGHGNSVPRFHVTWGTGPALVAPFDDPVDLTRPDWPEIENLRARNERNEPDNRTDLAGFTPQSRPRPAAGIARSGRVPPRSGA